VGQAAAQHGARVQAFFVDPGPVSEGSVVSRVHQASERLKPTLRIRKPVLLPSRLTHGDQSGVRIQEVLHWFPVMSTRWLPWYQWHRRRGREAMDAHGLVPAETGRLMHDRWKRDQASSCAPGSRGAHLVRGALAVAELEK